VTQRAQIRILPDQRRLHLQDGPIDLIVEAFGDSREVQRSYEAAAERFVNVLDELCAELPLLRAQALPGGMQPKGKIAKGMAEAVAPYAERTFITPMAAVAGAVAEEILETMSSVARLRKAYVNDGGDIALHLEQGEHFVVGVVQRPDRPSLFATATVTSEHCVRGIATSGSRGRSFSLGIADAVTVLAERAAQADAAATIIANAVDLPGNPKIVRVPACSLAPDSDLGELLVTQDVGTLSVEEVDCALRAGMFVAKGLAAEGVIHSAALHLNGETRVVGAALSLTPLNLTETAHRSLVHA
jgi:ApbE superfamily uncharacterized protein (UPF0280 family)